MRDRRAGQVMRENAAILDSFCRDVEKLGGKVKVSISGTGVAGQKEPPHDLVLDVTGLPKRPDVYIRVVDKLSTAVAALRDKLKLEAV